MNTTGYKTRGVVYLVWKGECDPSNVLVRSQASVRHWHPELEQRVVEMPNGSNLLCKSHMYDLSPFDQTLFLDADTTVLGNLDYGFLQAAQHGIACCINANPWSRRYYKLEQHPDAVEYSSGVVFFDKTCRGVKEVFKRWNGLDGTDTTCSYFHASDGLKQAPYNDQALFTLAMDQEKFNPFVLSMNWNIYPKWQKHFWGPIKIWHGYDDISPAVMQWNEKQSAEGAVIQCAVLP